MGANANGSGGRLQIADPHVREVVCRAERELHQLLLQRAEVMKRIGTIKQTLAGLANIFGKSALNDELLALLDRGTASRRPGLTRACRLVLMNSQTPIGIPQICEELQRRFPEVLQHHRDPRASVTTVLSRLVDYAEARTFLQSNGRRGWEWIADGRRAPATEPIRTELG